MKRASPRGSLDGYDASALVTMYPNRAIDAFAFEFTPELTFSWNAVTGAVAYHVYQGFWYPYQDYETGETRWGYSYGPVWSGSTTTFTISYLHNTGDTSCGLFYAIAPIYASGKEGEIGAYVVDVAACPN